jgi:hypothetical protein
MDNESTQKVTFDINSVPQESMDKIRAHLDTIEDVDSDWREKLVYLAWAFANGYMLHEEGAYWPTADIDLDLAEYETQDCQGLHQVREYYSLDAIIPLLRQDILN